MTQKPAFWYGLQASTLLLYALLICGGYLLKLPALGWGLYGALFLLHVVELKTALQVGRRDRGLSTLRIVIMNLIFGFTWWVPLKRGIIQR
jgi:hypothetical protein